MRILDLTIKKEWFDKIKSGEKKVEFREFKPHWIKRLLKDSRARPYDAVRFRNGYKLSSPTLLVEWKGVHYETWEGKHCFAIQLGEILI